MAFASRTDHIAHLVFSSVATLINYLPDLFRLTLSLILPTFRLLPCFPVAGIPGGGIRATDP